MYRTFYQLNNSSSSTLDNSKFNHVYHQQTLEEKISKPIDKPIDKPASKIIISEKKSPSKKSEKSEKTTKKSPEKTTKKSPEKTTKKSPEKTTKKTTEKLESGVCSMDDDGVKHICGSDAGNLFAIMDPRFNLREACKNMILLEDHLFHSGKRCQDCIFKHSLTIEAFLEEGVTLDKKSEYKKIFDDSSKSFRIIFKKLVEDIKSGSLNDEDCSKIAQEIRQIRKPLCQEFASFLS